MEGNKNRRIMQESIQRGLREPHTYVSRWWISSHRREVRLMCAGTTLEDWIEYCIESADESL